MSEKYIKVIHYEPYKFGEVRTIANDWRRFQKQVEGNFEMHYIGGNLAIVCNEEGKIFNMEPNRFIPELADTIAGPFFICRTDGEECVSLTKADIKLLKELLP